MPGTNGPPVVVAATAGDVDGEMPWDVLMPWEAEYGTAWDPAFGPFVVSPPVEAAVVGDPTCAQARWLRLAEPDPPGVDAATVLMDRIEAVEGLLTQLQAVQARHLEQFYRLRTGQTDPTAPACTVDPDGWMPSEVAVALGLSVNQVRKRLLYADALTRYRHVHDLVGDGAVPAFTAVKLVEGLDRLSVHVTEAVLDLVEAQLVEWLRTERPTVAALDRRLRALLLDAQARARATTEGSVFHAHADRQVRITALDDGTAELWARLPETDALAVAAVLRELGRRPAGAEDTRTATQRRADILVGRTTGNPAAYGQAADVPDSHRDIALTVTIDVTIPVDTLTGDGPAPGDVPGHGAIPAATARDLAAHPSTRFRALLYDSTTGHLLGLAPTGDLTKILWIPGSKPAAGYQHPTTMDDLIHARDRTCRHAHCTRPARRCDSDHITAWPDGPTSLPNSAALCRYHHRLKTHAPGWKVTGTGDGLLLWRTPTGRTSTTRPHDHRPPTSEPDEPPF